MMRRVAAKSDRKRDAGLTIPESVTYIRDLSYGENASHTLDLCYPKDAEEDLPLIISFHGGGYVYGSTKIYQYYCADLATRGFAVVNFNYRLAPKYRFPAPLEDLQQVIGWLCDHKDAYPLDLNNVFLVGDSAGAQLASQYAAIYSNPEYAALMGFEKPDIKLRAVGLNCGFYDMTGQLQTEGLKGIMVDYLGKNPERYGQKLDVLSYITADYPPAYLFTAGGDFLKDKCEPMAELLAERGVPCAWKVYGDESIGHVFHVNVRLDTGKEANDDQTAFFRKYLQA